MSLYKCKNCQWRWRDSSFFAGVQADGCPKCKSNVIDRVNEAEEFPPAAHTEASGDEQEELVFQILLNGWTDKTSRVVAKQIVLALQAHIDAECNRARVDELQLIASDADDWAYHTEYAIRSNVNHRIAQLSTPPANNKRKDDRG